MTDRYHKEEKVIIANRSHPFLQKMKQDAMKLPPNSLLKKTVSEMTETALVADFVLREYDTENPFSHESDILKAPFPGVTITEVEIATGEVKQSVELDSKEACALAKAILSRFAPDYLKKHQSDDII